MTENSRQPKPDDAVLGGQNYQQINAAVLGGMEGVKHRLASGNVKSKIAALQEALKYGQNGLELLIQALRDDVWRVQCQAYSLLQNNAESGLKQALRAYNPYLLKCFHTLNGHSDRVNAVVFSPDGRTIASCSIDRTIKLWDVETGVPKITLNGHSDRVNAVVFSPNGRTLASCSSDNTIKLWDVETGVPKITLNGHSNNEDLDSEDLDSEDLDSEDIIDSIVFRLSGRTLVSVSVAFSPDGRTIASCSSDNTIKRWDVETGVPKIILNGHSADSVDSIAFSPDGQTLVSGSSNNTMKLWDVETGILKSTLTGHSDSVDSVAFSPDSRTLASCSSDNTIKLWGKDNSTQFKREPIEFFHRYLALKEAEKSGKSGLKLLIKSLKDESWSVRQVAYYLLQESDEPRARQKLQELYNIIQSVSKNKTRTHLEFLLASEKWKEAEEETENILLKVSGCKRGTLPRSLLQLNYEFTLATDLNLSSCIPDQVLRYIYAVWENYNKCSSFNEQKFSLVFWLELKYQIKLFFQKKGAK